MGPLGSIVDRGVQNRKGEERTMAIAKKKKKKKKDYKIFPSSQISSIIFLKRNVRKEIGHHIFRFCWGPKWLKLATELPAHVGLVQQSPQEHVYMHLGISSYTGQDRQFFKNVNIILFSFNTKEVKYNISWAYAFRNPYEVPTSIFKYQNTFKTLL